MMFLLTLSLHLSVSSGAVVIRRDDVWPMVRIYRGGFLLIEFLFLLGAYTHTHTHSDAKLGDKLPVIDVRTRILHIPGKQT